jgi:Polyketide synthase modules and related proteins
MGQRNRMSLKNAIENAGITADEISYIEAHGTGTSLGDLLKSGH